MGDKNRTLSADPNLPRWACQNCRNPLCIVGVDSYADKFFTDPSRSGMQVSSIDGASSVLSSTRMDNSYVVLGQQQPLTQGNPPSCRKAMEDSFVLVRTSESTSDGSGTHASPGADPNGHMQPHNSGFNSTITLLKRAFDIATTQTQVEQPLCLECMRVLLDKLDKEAEDLNRDIEAYEACLEGEVGHVLSEADFLKEKLKIEEEGRRLEAAIEETEKQNAEVNAELKELELKSSRFKELEERYWHEFNNFQFQLTSFQEERDAIWAKVEVSQAHLELLKRTNVLNDAFPISHDGEFGTINNFRLGRLPKVPVEWDEINAAWGQACLLLHTMCQYFRRKFQSKVKIIPMGSYPRIMDSSNYTYDLFGPVNLFWSTRYDKAMTLFLVCLKEFAEFINSMDQQNGIPSEKCFKLPYKIENDKVEIGADTYSITQSFNKHENWTKALKLTLCNLKWVLYWFIGNTDFRPLPAVEPLHMKPSNETKSESRK